MPQRARTTSAVGIRELAKAVLPRPAYEVVRLIDPRVPERPYVIDRDRRALERSWDQFIASQRVVSLAEYASTTPTKGIEEFIACQLCGSDMLQLLFTDAGHKLGVNGRYRVVRCASCGHLYRNPNIKPERLGELYAKKYSDFLSGDYITNRVKKYRRTMDAFSPIFDDGKQRRILDFGCGIGLFLELAHERGFETYGVDLSQDSIDQARARAGGERTWCGAPTDIPEIAAGGFDIITMWSVLAHLPRAEETIRMLTDLLVPGGTLLIFTVNANSLLLKRNRNRWNGFTKNHLFYYSSATLTTLLEKAGLTDVDFRPVYGDRVEDGDFHSTFVLQRYRRTVEQTDGGNMLRAIAHKPS